MTPLTPESIRASKANLPPIGSVITKLRRQDPYIQQEQHRYRSPRGFQHWANHPAFAAMIEASLQVMDEMNEPIGSGLLKGTSKNWPWRSLGPHPLQLLQWVSLVSPRGTRIFRGALKRPETNIHIFG